MSRKLKPPKNKRWKTPHTCAFCKDFVNDGSGSCHCQRDPEDTTWDTGDSKYHQQTCDRWR